MLSFYPTTIW